MSIESARAFRERLFVDLAFRRTFETARRDLPKFLRDNGYRFESETWNRLQQEIESESRAAAGILGLLHEGKTKEAREVSRRALDSNPRSWQLLDVHAAVLGRLGQREESLALLSDLTVSNSRVAYLDPTCRQRALDILASTIAYALWKPCADAGVGRSLTECGPRQGRSGGWCMALDPSAWPLRHRVVHHDSLSVADFIERFAHRSQPVIIGGLIDGDGWTARSSWRRESLIQELGTAEVGVYPTRSVIDHLRHERPPEQIRLSEYVARMRRHPSTTYLFKGLDISRFREAFDEPPHFPLSVFSSGRPLRDAQTLFFLGGAGSGVGFHQHLAAWNGLVFGYKRWFLLPPHAIRRYRSTDIEGLVRSGDPELIEFVQLPGEIVFVPQYWHHATFNLTECVGVAREIGSVCDLICELRKLVR